MTVEQKRKRIQRVLDAEFVDLNTTQAQRDRILANTIGREHEAVSHIPHEHLLARKQGGESVRL